MPYVEVGTSQKDPSFDADGYATITRTFKVWDVNPRVIFTNPGSIMDQAGQVGMPEIGTVLQVVNGPRGLFGVDSDIGVKTNLRLVRYTCQSISNLVFYAIAHYTNDPREAPLGQDYRTTGQFTIVNIPIAKKAPGILVGATGTGAALPVFVEDSLGVPMATKRHAQKVTVKRKDLKKAEQAADTMVNHLHEVQENYICRFEGYDVNLRSPQWVDITYNWVWEAGILSQTEFSQRVYGWGDDDFGSVPNQPTLKPVYPTGVRPLYSVLGTVPWVLPKYHTIRLNWDVTTIGSTTFKRPYWEYRCPHPLALEEWRNLYGFENFEWRLQATP